MFANFIGYFLVAQIRLGPEARPVQLLRNIGGIVGLLLGNIEDDGLNRCQPQRQRPGEVLDQDADEALERAKNGPVQDDGNLA